VKGRRAVRSAAHTLAWPVLRESGAREPPSSRPCATLYAARGPRTVSRHQPLSSGGGPRVQPENTCPPAESGSAHTGSEAYQK